MWSANWGRFWPDMTDAPLYDDLCQAPAGGAAHWVETSDGVRLRIAFWGGGEKHESKYILL